MFVQDGCPGGPLSPLTALLFSALNLSSPSLTAVAKLHRDGNLTAACNAVALHFTEASTASWLRLQAPTRGIARIGGEVDAIMLNDTYVFYGEIGRVPREADGGLDWYCNGPVDDDEFKFALNRHEAWQYDGFLSAWLATGNGEYAKAFDARVADWTLHNLPAPARAKNGHNTTWRTIEAGIRASSSWSTAFFGFLKADEFKGSSRCAMVVGLAEHGRYLHAFGDAGNSNWRSMQYNGLGTLALTLPELNNAAAWFKHAEDHILADMRTGVYLDGVEDEETSSYHEVALNSFDELFQMVLESGRAPNPEMAAIIEKMYNYLAYSMDAVGIAPLNGDADTENNTDYVAYGAQTFNRTDWMYITTGGANGTRPAGPPSAMFSWAGQMISRSGWDRGAQWSWFDVGPFGSSSHGHRDKTHLSIRIGAVQLLVDAGRFSYDGNLAHFRTDYAVQSTGHNVLLIDGKGQVNTPAKATAPLPANEWSISTDTDRARGSITFEGLAGRANHTRSIVYQRGRFWVVVDRVDSDRARSVEALWHAHPNSTMMVPPPPLSGGTTTRIVDNTTRVGLDIVSATAVGMRGGSSWDSVEVIIGQTKPVLQGWHSPRYGTYSASPVLSCKAQLASGRRTFAWLLVPTKGGVPSKATASIRSEATSTVTVDVVVDGKASTIDVSF